MNSVPVGPIPITIIEAGAVHFSQKLDEFTAAVPLGHQAVHVTVEERLTFR